MTKVTNMGLSVRKAVFRWDFKKEEKAVFRWDFKGEERPDHKLKVQETHNYSLNGKQTASSINLEGNVLSRYPM